MFFFFFFPSISSNHCHLCQPGFKSEQSISNHWWCFACDSIVTLKEMSVKPLVRVSCYFCVLSSKGNDKANTSDCVQSVDMSAEMSSEAMEVITMSVDKHAATKNYEVSP
jgi:hypothetical protein